MLVAAENKNNSTCALVEDQSSGATGMQQKNSHEELNSYNDCETCSTEYGEYTTMYAKAEKDLAGVKGHKARWEEMYVRLKMYRQNHGHCLVPNRCKEDPKLGTWVATQRRQYKAQLKGSSKTPLCKSRIERLNRIGFEWTVKELPASNSEPSSWEEIFKKFVDFVADHGHGDVSAERGELSDWVTTQRQQYDLLISGKPSQLTPDRIRLLNNVGFIWKAKPERGNDSNKKTAPPRNAAVLEQEKELALIRKLLRPTQCCASPPSIAIGRSSHTDDILPLAASTPDTTLRELLFAQKRSLSSLDIIEELVMAQCRKKRKFSESLMADSHQLLTGASASPFHQELSFPADKEPRAVRRTSSGNSSRREQFMSDLVLNGTRPTTASIEEQLSKLNRSELLMLLAGGKKRSKNLGEDSNGTSFTVKSGKPTKSCLRSDFVQKRNQHRFSM